jgi:hypothetical protein
MQKISVSSETKCCEIDDNQLIMAAASAEKKSKINL